MKFQVEFSNYFTIFQSQLQIFLENRIIKTKNLKKIKVLKNFLSKPIDFKKKRAMIEVKKQK